ncbi:MAG: lipopolysaccharide/colanic/teichoic acid biosynthesis glycosyltransferase [Candidatus Azotimanducaceae bacterium]|jgi:lipopolysaccharide/colanic/teichoic acid biosynthesis glycosyltransferase
MGINEGTIASNPIFNNEVRGPGTQLSYKTIKRTLDIVIATIGLFCLAPFAFLLGLAIKFESSGPVFFSHSRVGLLGKKFKCWKFRSMRIDADTEKSALIAQNEMEGGVLFKMRNDPRVSKLGRVLRALSIDELPQLWNVLQGDMSLVGPRPPVPEEVMQYSDYEMRRLNVVPGITCIWQVSGRSEIPFSEQVRMDLTYISKQSIWLDLKLLILTVPAVISCKGAY